MYCDLWPYVLWPLDFGIQIGIVSAETIWGNTVGINNEEYPIFMKMTDFSGLRVVELSNFGFRLYDCTRKKLPRCPRLNTLLYICSILFQNWNTSMLYGPNVLYLKVVNDSNKYKLKLSSSINLHYKASKTLIMKQANFTIKILKAPEKLNQCCTV